MSLPSKSARESVPFGIRVAGAWSGYLLLVAAALAVAVWAIAKLGLVTVSFVTGVMVAALLQPMVSGLVRRGLSRGLAATLSFLVGLAGVGALVWFVVAQIVGSSAEFSRQLDSAERRARSWLMTGPAHLSGSTADKYTVHLKSTVSSHSSDLMAQFGSHVGALTGALSGFVLTLFCILFLLSDDGSMYRWFVRLLPERVRGDAEVAGAAAWRTLVVYMRSLVLLAVLNAGAMLPVLWIAGVPLAVPLTVALFLGSLIPLVGVLLVGVLIFAIAFIGKGLLTAVVVVAILAVVIQLFGNLVNPIILGKFVNLHPIVIMLGVTAGTILGGAFGAFTAVPLIAVVNNMAKVISRRRTALAAGEVDDAELLTESELEALAKDAL